MTAARKMPAWLNKALFGPKCRQCKRHRTTNPSKACTACLGARACGRCKGSGIDTRGFYAGLAACPECPGTGLVSAKATEKR